MRAEGLGFREHLTRKQGKPQNPKPKLESSTDNRPLETRKRIDTNPGYDPPGKVNETIEPKAAKSKTVLGLSNPGKIQ